MIQRIIAGTLLVAAGLTTLMAQRPKSQKEVEALQAMFSAKSADERIAAAETLITKFADTEFKDIALYMEAFSYQQKGDAPKAVVFGERTIEANPKHYQAMIMLAELTAQQTGEFDLDKEEKLTKATKYANDAIATVAAANKPNPNMTDDQWTATKKDLTAQAHQALGMVAMVRKKNDDAIKEFKLAVETSSNSEPAFQVRLAQAYVAAGKNDDAIAICEKIMADPNAHPQVKQVAQALRVNALKAKGAIAPKPAAAAPAAAPAPAPAEVKKP